MIRKKRERDRITFYNTVILVWSIIKFLSRRLKPFLDLVLSRALARNKIEDIKLKTKNFIAKENRKYIRVEFRQFLGMNFVSLFQPERAFKVYKSCKCSQIICSRVH